MTMRLIVLALLHLAVFSPLSLAIRTPRPVAKKSRASRLSVSSSSFLSRSNSAQAVVKNSLEAPPNRLISELKNYGNAQYTIDVVVGGQHIEMIPDTGSFSVMVTSTLCPKAECPKRAFAPANSSTYKDLQGNHSVHFGSGTVWVEKAEDEVSLGPFQQRQVFWEIDRIGPKMTEMFHHAEFEGILGLGWSPEVPNTKEVSFLESLNIEAFTVCLGFRKLGFGNYNDTGTPSRIYWGYPPELDEAVFKDAAVLGIQHWAVRLEHVQHEYKPNQKQELTGPFACAKPGDKCAAIIDTGFSLIGVPAQHIGDLLGGLPHVNEDCSNYDELPDISLYLGGARVKLTPEIYIRKVDYTGLKKNKWFWERMKARLAKKGRKPMDFTCELAFVVQGYSSTEGAVWILGQSFMQHHLVRFDRGRKTVGISDHPGICPGTGEKASDLESEEKVLKDSSLLLTGRKTSSGVRNFEQQRGGPSGPWPVDAEALWPGSLFSSSDSTTLTI